MIASYPFPETTVTDNTGGAAVRRCIARRGADLGFHMPAEWEAHESTWISWPHNPETWPGTGRVAAAEQAMVSAVAALAEAERVRINVLDPAHESHVRGLLRARVPPESVRFHRLPTNDAWIRDYGAIFVESGRPKESLVAVDFEFNAWGDKYPPYDLDQQVGLRMAEILGLEAYAPGIVLEGGSIDVNGAGALLTTTQCLLNKNRNPRLTQMEIESVLRSVLGVSQFIWLGEGIEGDDTDGHVDDVTRFVGPRTVVTAVESNRQDRNHAALAANRRRLADTVLDIGGKLEIVDLPMPEPLIRNGLRLPASYANFYIANDVVLVPVFACEQDSVACGVLEDCFPGRRIAAIDSRALVEGLGALHCLTQQVPRSR